MGDHIEKIDGESLVGCRHYEVETIFLTSWMILQHEKYGEIKVDEVFERLADVKELRNVEIMTLH